MQTLIDTVSGKPFRYNATVRIVLRDGSAWIVPQYKGRVRADHIHPCRVPARLLAQLNDGRVWVERRERV